MKVIKIILKYYETGWIGKYFKAEIYMKEVSHYLYTYLYTLFYMFKKISDTKCSVSLGIFLSEKLLFHIAWS